MHHEWKVVHGGKEGHRSVSMAVTGVGANVSLAQRQARLSAFEGLADLPAQDRIAPELELHII
jgi:hypothetical protein